MAHFPLIQLPEPQTGRVAIFPDVHLSDNWPERTRDTVGYLENALEWADALILLGDLWEFWPGYHCLIPSYSLPVVNVLARYKEAGTPVYHFLGNHDFTLGRFWTEELGIRACDGPHVFVYGERRFAACHGDEYDLKLSYRLLHWFNRTRLFHEFIRTVPPWFTDWLAHKLGSASKRAHGAKRIPMLGYAQDRLWRKCVEDGADTLFAGHLHVPEVRAFNWTDHKLHVIHCGDFISHMTSGEYSIERGGVLHTWER